MVFRVPLRPSNASTLFETRPCFARFEHFRGNSSEVPFHEPFTPKLSHFQSRLIKLFFVFTALQNRQIRPVLHPVRRRLGEGGSFSVAVANSSIRGFPPFCIPPSGFRISSASPLDHCTTPRSRSKSFRLSAKGLAKSRILPRMRLRFCRGPLIPSREIAKADEYEFYGARQSPPSGPGTVRHSALSTNHSPRYQPRGGQGTARPATGCHFVSLCPSRT